MKRAKYICLEGTEGVGKTTQTQLLYDYLRSQGYSVLLTKEPGTPHSPLTMVLRSIMLDNQYDKEITAPAREYISQAIRSIHLERVIVPALSEYDYIIQDRGILSGYAYGSACGNDMYMIQQMTETNVKGSGIPLQLGNITDLPFSPGNIYDKVIYLKGNSKKGLQRAKTTKQEFTTGDAMESRGDTFIEKASTFMDEYSSYFRTCTIEVDGKSIDEVHRRILQVLELKEQNGQQEK